LIGCLVAVFKREVVQAIEAFCLSFVNVSMSLFYEVMMFEQVVRLWIIVSSCSCIAILRQVNVAVVATA
jgi:hypothetical protein